MRKSRKIHQYRKNSSQRQAKYSGKKYFLLYLIFGLVVIVFLTANIAGSLGIGIFNTRSKAEFEGPYMGINVGEEKPLNVPTGISGTPLISSKKCYKCLDVGYCNQFETDGFCQYAYPSDLVQCTWDCINRKLAGMATGNCVGKGDPCGGTYQCCGGLVCGVGSNPQSLTCNNPVSGGPKPDGECAKAGGACAQSCSQQYRMGHMDCGGLFCCKDANAPPRVPSQIPSDQARPYPSITPGSGSAGPAQPPGGGNPTDKPRIKKDGCSNCNFNSDCNSGELCQADQSCNQGPTCQKKDDSQKNVASDDKCPCDNSDCAQSPGTCRSGGGNPDGQHACGTEWCCCH